MGEVNEPENAIDHGIANSNQRILPSHGYPAQYVREVGAEKVNHECSFPLVDYNR